MKRKSFVIFLAVFLFSALNASLGAEMTGNGYEITTNVTAGGGGEMESAGYKMNFTVGESLSSEKPTDPPLPGNYGMEAGFWNTTATGPSCGGYDKEPDGDIDALDLAAYAGGGSFADVKSFAAVFGSLCRQ